MSIALLIVGLLSTGLIVNYFPILVNEKNINAMELAEVSFLIAWLTITFALLS